MTTEPIDQISESRTSEFVIWVLEDDPVDQRLITSALSSVADLAPAVMVRTAEELVELLDAAEEYPSLFLIDLNTPGIGGVNLTRELRGRDGLATVPIVVLTSSVNPRDHEDAARAGANAYHVKPFDWRKFNELISLVVSYWSLDGTKVGRQS